MSRLTWRDLLIEDISPDQFRDWLAPWAGLVAGQVAPAFLNKFGFWFLRRPDGSVEMLDVFAGTLERLSESYAAFMREVNDPSWQEIYLFSDLVYQLHQDGKIPGTGQCYALAPHPALGGPNPANGDVVDPKFVLVMDVPAWQAICAQYVG
jgi:hypothetical protein